MRKSEKQEAKNETKQAVSDGAKQNMSRIRHAKRFEQELERTMQQKYTSNHHRNPSLSLSNQPII